MTLLTQDIEDAFDAGEKAGVVLLDLSAAYDTVWLRGLHLKLLQMIPDRHMVKFIMEMLYNRSFTLNTSDGQCSRQRRLKNGVPQGSVLAPMLFNVYIHDLPVTQAKKYGYADDLAILLQKKSWEDIEGGLLLIESLHDSRPMLGAGSSSGVELCQVFVGTGLWQDGAD